MRESNKTILIKSKLVYVISSKDFNLLKKADEEGELYDWENGTFDQYNRIIEMIEKKYKPILKIDFKG